MRILIIFIFLALYSCKTNSDRSKHNIDPQAKRLLDSAIQEGSHNGDFQKGIFLINQSLQIDSNYFGAYNTKFGFLGMMTPYNKDTALGTLLNMIRLKPIIPEFYLYSGIIYIQKGDSLRANTYLSLAKDHLNSFLDTMSKNNTGYEVLLSDKAYTLILLGEEEKGHALVNEILKTDKNGAYDEKSLRIWSKSRREIIDSLKKM
jgi:hypothetical protein